MSRVWKLPSGHAVAIVQRVWAAAAPQAMASIAPASSDLRICIVILAELRGDHASRCAHPFAERTPRQGRPLAGAAPRG